MVKDRTGVDPKPLESLRFAGPSVKIQSWESKDQRDLDNTLSNFQHIDGLSQGLHPSQTLRPDVLQPTLKDELKMLSSKKAKEARAVPGATANAPAGNEKAKISAQYKGATYEWSTDAPQLVEMVDKLGPLNKSIRSEAFLFTFFQDLNLKGSDITDMENRLPLPPKKPSNTGGFQPSSSSSGSAPPSFLSSDHSPITRRAVALTQNCNRFTSLGRLNLSDNRLTQIDFLPPNLQFLNVYNNPLKKINLQSPHASLVHLGAGCCLLGDAAIPPLALSLPKLISLDLTMNPLTSLLSLLGWLTKRAPKLKHFHFAGTDASFHPRARLCALGCIPSLQVINDIEVVDAEREAAEGIEATHLLLSWEVPLTLKFFSLRGLRKLVLLVASEQVHRERREAAAAGETETTKTEEPDPGKGKGKDKKKDDKKDEEKEMDPEELERERKRQEAAALEMDIQERAEALAQRSLFRFVLDIPSSPGDASKSSSSSHVVEKKEGETTEKSAGGVEFPQEFKVLFPSYREALSPPEAQAGGKKGEAPPPPDPNAAPPSDGQLDPQVSFMPLPPADGAAAGDSALPPAGETSQALTLSLCVGGSEGTAGEQMWKRPSVFLSRPATLRLQMSTEPAPLPGDEPQAGGGKGKDAKEKGGKGGKEKDEAQSAAEEPPRPPEVRTLAVGQLDLFDLLLASPNRGRSGRKNLEGFGKEPPPISTGTQVMRFLAPDMSSSDEIIPPPPGQRPKVVKCSVVTVVETLIWSPYTPIPEPSLNPPEPVATKGKK
uniref:Uncharacterized protein n=1 Tax=Chromera velia CCMP2878 TaxID=1169474 RepID=A0A0G4GYP5_9ALVE|eukprot:Cvel_5410.t1-p1 / transcript=Cvel_5410.t1 / gene=Cvel_5410 / organism=Chromera_velia_CCMP2878 / gene_product=hypothetical protein / transcript_product=hypothetical protein / location=Cvel_scaffold252:9619-13979(-) / protein_length=772 / sequence_SO=supercontig / SO=protein_coding / is_pseudo=false